MNYYNGNYNGMGGTEEFIMCVFCGKKTWKTENGPVFRREKLYTDDRYDSRYRIYYMRRGFCLNCKATFEDEQHDIERG